MKKSTRLLLILSSLFLAVSIFVPIWRIDLDAPQYPEGLSLLIYSNKLGGAVEIINGLNHYIGMKTLHANDFVEFSVLPYIIGFYAMFSLVVALINKKKLLTFLFIAFVLFGVVAMIDFWRWEYDYGHNLNPDAAIIVPGMAYQPPLIGFKQLLNFGAYSIPDIGGILFILAGLFMLVSVWMERESKLKVKVKIITILVGTLFITSCNSEGPSIINFNKDNCDNCKMTISDPKFACEIKTTKGKAYKFDDLICMQEFCNEESNNNIKLNIKNYYLADYLNNNTLIKIEELILLQSESIESPMGGGYAAFTSMDFAKKYKQQYGAVIIRGNAIFNVQ